MSLENQILIKTDPIAEEHAQKLIGTALALNSELDFERSVKIHQRGVDFNRLLVGFDAHILTLADLEDLCEAMAMPPDLRAQAAAEFDAPSSLLVGFEEAAGQPRFKLYFEFWDRLKTQINSGSAPTAPVLLNVGFKWDLADPARHDVTRYTCHPLLTVNEINARLREIVGRADPTSGSICQNIVLKAARLLAKPTFVYMEAAEENDRRSFDLNLYSGELELGHIDEELEGIREAFALPADALDPLRLYKYKTVGHLSGGADRAGRPFVTIYFEDELTARVG